MKPFTFLTSLLILLSATAAFGADAKVVFISGTPSHGPGAHEHRAGNLLLARAIEETDLPIEAVVLPENGYPKDPSILEGAATVVVFCTGHDGHLLNPVLGDFGKLMEAGTGVVMIHWATEAKVGPPAKRFLEWMGGYCGLNWSVNPHWKPSFTTFPDHPVAQGLTPFALNDEWYYHMRFVPDLKGITPILSAVPGPETLKRPDGPRSGNPHVRKAVANGESQHVAWTYDRPDGKGRGFGFTGAHNHSSWKDDNFRKVVLNAIVWTAHVEVPEGGVPSRTPTNEEMKQNWDDKLKGKKKPAPEKPPVAIPNLDEARKGQAKPMEQGESLRLISEALEKTEDSGIRKSLLKGMLLGLKGQRNVRPPANWIELSKGFAATEDEELKRLTLQLRQIFGEKAAAQEALATLKDPGAQPADRRLALASLLSQENAALLPELESLLEDEELRVPAIRAYSSFESPKAAGILLARYPDSDPPTQRAILETLVTRKEYAEALLAHLEEGKIKPDALPAYVSRSLGGLLGERFTAKYGIQPLSGEKEKAIARYRKLATPAALESASATEGRAVYQRICMACHKMYEEGGIIGPDLTGSNRANLDYLLLNILDPSGDIPDSYKMITVSKQNGQILSGAVTEEDDQRLVLSMVGQKTTVLKSDIKERITSPISMMPEGLLETLKEKEVLNLFRYLQTKKQVALPR